MFGCWAGQGDGEARAIWCGSSVAITGATGFIGRHLVRELSRRGYLVRVLLRRPIDMQLDCASAVIGDLARPQNLSAALQGVDAVVHSAGVAHGATGVPEADHRILNAEATRNLARAAQRVRVGRFVFLSSIRAQTGAVADGPVTEERPAAPTDAYGRSKLEAEQALAELDIDWVALRPVLVYGHGVKRQPCGARKTRTLPLAAAAWRAEGPAIAPFCRQSR